MEQHVQAVKTALEQHFAGADAADIAWEPRTNRISGLLLWDGFDPLTHRERQRIIFDFLREELDAESTNVSLIFAYSPREYEIMQSVSQAA